MNRLSNTLRIVAIAMAIEAGSLAAAEPSPVAPKTPPQRTLLDSIKLVLQPGAASEPGPVAAEGQLRDPTEPSPRMRQLIDAPKAQGKALELPVVELKARIVGGNQGGVAMLQIDKRLIVVRQGSEIALDGMHYGAQRIRVVELNANEVRLDLQPLDRVLTLR
jgi:hypothetical protein